MCRPSSSSSNNSHRRALAALLLTGLLAFAGSLAAQVRYDSGQNVVAVFEGWEHNPDGSFNMVFGYMNRNYGEEIDIPVGPNNMIEPGPADQGQPTHFYVRRQQFVFKVRVPKDWGKKDVVWTLTTRGKTEKAYGSLLPFWELGNLVYQENRGGPGEIGTEQEPNDPPSITLEGPAQRTAAVGEVITLSTAVTDDGHPRRAARSTFQAPQRTSDGPDSAAPPVPVPARGAPVPVPSGSRRESPLTQMLVRLDQGVALGVTWIVYRGAGADSVAFNPMRVAVKDGKAVTHVTFSRPGTYVLRGYADDGVLITPVDVAVTVRGGA
jgi:hypothetical protein